MASVSTSAAPNTSAKPRLSSRDRRVLDETFSIDTRALSVVRILLAGLVLFQILVLESGQVRAPAVFVDYLTQFAHIALIPFAVMMLVGYRTKLALIASWILYSAPYSVDMVADNAFPMGFYILSLGLFWSMFLPMSRHWAIDARRESQQPVRYLSVATGALLFQIFIIYFSAGMLKDMGEWVIDATAMESILSHPNYMTPLGTWLLDYPTALAAMSVATYLIEVVGALLVIVPGKSLAKRRLVMVPVFIFLHVGIALFMGIGLFPYVMIALWLVYLPSGFWDRMSARLGLGTSPAEAMSDTNRWRNGLAGVAVVIASISNLITWMSYPNFRNLEGVIGMFQDIAGAIMLYQAWLMFNVPSMIPA